MTSLQKYLEKQLNILTHLKFMSEPILHMTERKDSLDIMQEMNMQELLKHPVVVEVLNLVYEGKYSVSSNALNMSTTFQCLMEDKALDHKSMLSKQLANIQAWGDTESTKQSSVQYHIWKQSIKQRESDEMLFTLIVNACLVYLSAVMNQVQNDSFSLMTQYFSPEIVRDFQLFSEVTDLTLLKPYCTAEQDNLLRQNSLLTMFTFFMILDTAGNFVCILQDVATVRYKDNVELDRFRTIY